MSWKDEIDAIEARRHHAREAADATATKKQHARGRLTVRERLSRLLDDGSLREFGEPTDAEGASSLIIGAGRVDGRALVVGADDFSVRGGAYTMASLKKSQYAERLALQRRVPLVRLLESGGASISGGYARRGASGYDLTAPAPMNLLALAALSQIPVACAALGPCAGFPAARLAASHFSVMTRDAAVLVAGPALVARALGTRHTKEELGGAQVHRASGVVNNIAESEDDALAQVRRFLSYLPQNAWALPPRARCSDPPEREDPALLEAVPRAPRRAYQVRRIIERVCDAASFFELTPGYGRTQVTGLARLGGFAVGVIANDCRMYGGGLCAEGAQKIRRFVELCDTFNLPVLSLVDEPGFQIGPRAEASGVIRFGMEAAFAVLQSSVPWFSVVLRKSFGVAQGIHFGPRATVAAWPSMQSGALPVESGVELAFGKEIANAEDPSARRRELEDEMLAAQSISARAEEFGVHMLIDPRRTRPVLCEWIADAQTQLEQTRGPKKYSPRP